MEGMTLPLDAKKGPNCAVMAVAIAANRPFHEVFDKFKETFNKKGQWRGTTNRHQYLRMFTYYGVKFEEVKKLKGTNLYNWNRFYAQKNVRYIVRTSSHLQLVKNGVLIDQHGLRNIQPDDWTSKKHVKQIWKIIE